LKEANAVIVERQQETKNYINCERIPLHYNNSEWSGNAAQFQLVCNRTWKNEK